MLGLFPDAPFMSSVKYVFWSSNPLGDALDDVLQRLVDVGVLEFRDDDDEGRQYRWKLEDEGHSLAEGRGREFGRPSRIAPQSAAGHGKRRDPQPPHARRRLGRMEVAK